MAGRLYNGARTGTNPSLGHVRLKIMKLTKYEHSCMVLEQQDRLLVLDPGEHSKSLPSLGNVDAVIVSHMHSDHFDLNRLARIADQNKSVHIFGPKQVTEQSQVLNMASVNAGETKEVGPFQLKFVGGHHELYGEIENIGVIINGIFFYPGDSYAKPEQPIKTLALPASAPWLRVPDAINLMKECAPKTAFPVHNALLSKIGETIHYRLIEAAAQKIGADWRVLKTNESMEI